MKIVRERKQRKRTYKAALAGGMAVLLLLSGGTAGKICSATSAGEGQIFRDVNKGAWYQPFVTELAEEGIISGYPDGSFRPSEQVTVGQFLAMIVQTAQRTGVFEEQVEENATEKPTAEKTTAEGEAVQTHWARPFYEEAKEQELIFQEELPKTSLNQPIPRLWMAVMGSRLISTRSDMRLDGETFDETLAAITDMEERYPYSYEVVHAYGQGLLAGYPDGTFRPDGYLTRAEAATVIYKLNEMLAKDIQPEDLTPDRPQENPTPAQPQENPALDQPEDPTPAQPQASPAYGFEKDPADMPAGTKLFWYRLPAKDGTERGENVDQEDGTERDENVGQEDGTEQIKMDFSGIRQEMMKEVPQLAEQLYQSFEGFAQRAVIQQAQGKQGLRKEYAGGYPVLMEAVGGEVRVYIKPKGTETRFWGVEPGQISEEFF